LRSAWLICAPLVLSTLALTAHAEPITFTETLTGGGILGSSFTNQLITITGIGDTSNVEFSSATGTYTLDLSSVTVREGSGPVDTFTGNIEAFVSDDGYIAGFEELTPLNVNVAAVTGEFNGVSNSDPFAGFTLGSSISETGGTEVPESTNFATTGGSLVFETFSDTATFSAAVSPSPVPEPSSFALLATGLLGVVETARRKLKA
jgi:PEP-CTERM motif